MPLLAEEVNLYPENLLTDLAPSPDERWYVIYTRSRHEKTLARNLLALEMSFYLPLVAKSQFIRGRKMQSYLPLFQGYLFYYGNASHEVSQIAPYCVSSVLPVENQIQLVTELRGIQTLLVSGAQLTVESRLEPGQRVRVKSGALQGLEGTVIHRKNAKRLVLSVNYLQQGVSVEIDDFMVEPI